MRARRVSARAQSPQTLRRNRLGQAVMPPIHMRAVMDRAASTPRHIHALIERHLTDEEVDDLLSAYPEEVVADKFVITDHEDDRGNCTTCKHALPTNTTSRLTRNHSTVIIDYDQIIKAHPKSPL